MKKLLLIISSVLLCGVIFAKDVSISNAKIIAKQFYYKMSGLNVKISDIVITQEFTITNNSVLVYYVFNIDNDKGFVAVSAIDNVYPILCYSLNGKYNDAVSTQPSAFIEWMKNYENQILYAKNNNLSATKEITDMWNEYSTEQTLQKSQGQAVLPLTQHIQWGQACYYNANCPQDSKSQYCQHCPTGCPAIAMGQVMKFWGYPTQGKGQQSYTDDGGHGTLSANFSTSTYNWSAMPADRITSDNAEVAKICSHAGISVSTTYYPTGAGAYFDKMRNAMVNFFKFHSNALYAQGKNYTLANWKNLLKGDLNSSRPVFYAGATGMVGHVFICDGYDNNDYFHFNFGWYGQNNAYFPLDNINSAQGNFSGSQEAVLHLYPANIGIEEEASLNEIIIIYPNPITTNKINIDLQKFNTTTFSINIINVEGQIVYSKTLSNNNHPIETIDLSDYSKGIYFVKVQNNEKTIVNKLLIQ